MTNIVAIVGRPNVGKSTLFNRLVEQRKAIMDDQPGVTRDRHYGMAEWTDKKFTVIDTGGYVAGSDDVFEEAIRKQVTVAIEESSAIIFMVDCKDGLHDLDKDFANILRGSKKPVYVAANKADNAKLSYMVHEFHVLGLGDVYPISSASGSGTGELLDVVVKDFKSISNEDPSDGVPKIAILGRPNVGKSSFVNALIGEERSIVTDIAGTTRDAINTRYNMFGKDLILVDTAGIRKKSKVKEDLEFYSVMRAIRAMQDADVAVILLDAQHGLESQDQHLISLAHKYKKGIMIMVNKWDLVEKETNTMKAVTDEILQKLGNRNYIPVIFTSVLKKQRIFKALELALKIVENRKRKIPTSKLNDVLLPEIKNIPPPAVRGKYIKIKYITQLPSPTPAFAFFCNFPQYVKDSYRRFLENKLRDHFEFDGVPVSLYFRKK